MRFSTKEPHVVIVLCPNACRPCHQNSFQYHSKRGHVVQEIITHLIGLLVGNVSNEGLAAVWQMVFVVMLGGRHPAARVCGIIMSNQRLDLKGEKARAAIMDQIEVKILRWCDAKSMYRVSTASHAESTKCVSHVRVSQCHRHAKRKIRHAKTGFKRGEYHGSNECDCSTLESV